MSLEDSPSPPRDEKNYTAKEWARVRAEEWMQTIPPDDQPFILSPVQDEPLSEVEGSASGVTGLPQTQSPQQSLSTRVDSTNTPKSASDTLSHVLQLHTSRRMKPPSNSSEKVKQGVSIPSQRRWLYYWSLLLSREAPSSFWTDQPHPKIRINSITVRMKDLSPIKSRLVKAANAFLDRTTASKMNHGQIWVSLARYDDTFVSGLEKWEQHTRFEGHFGKRKSGSDHMDGEPFSEFFKEGQWDQKKMVRSFARLGIASEDSIIESKDETLGKFSTYLLRPLSDEKWGSLKKVINEERNSVESAGVASETASLNDVAVQTLQTERGGVVLDANREARCKIYIGQVFLGWFWFIPAFHISAEQNNVLKLTRKEVDFPLGLGSGLIDVEVSLERCEEPYVEPPSRVDSVGSEEGKGEPPGAIGNAVEAIATGNIGGAVETKQAAED